ncbi:ribonuclease III domain-containing protein [Trichoderma breve]|uniref:Large ribosomal subunit protein mL44 n=1 Tax=Trichoderma breve TaxID=2034170 RepID=A0A9W9JRG8_9HYPO|nr:ribonuclease III domain-containing protein [Trichoderma breve]KAJ4864555.1 ribonuclease III domain-containing protein [Trichoderma breve]
MKRIRPSRWSGQLLQARCGAGIAAARQPFLLAARSQSTSSAAAHDSSTTSIDSPPPLPAPSFARAAQSAKLAALHARLSLSKKIPLQTLARALVTPSADANPNFNNTNLAYLGSTIVNYHVLEYLVCKWPRLPMAILYEALRAYAGDASLQQVARRWGVESAAAPGEEVDPGLLQWKAGEDQLVNTRWGYVRSDKAPAWRRGLSSRVVLDNDFGDQSEAFGSVVQAVIGAIYTHCGREEVKAFVKSHILSRELDPSTLFEFKLPTRELAMLCAREGFEAPVARLESETGRLSRTPVYVVGIYSGKEKLGEGAGPSLDVARRQASMASLKAWYLYSPGNKVRVPSDMMEEGAKPWKAPYIDIGEII